MKWLYKILHQKYGTESTLQHPSKPSLEDRIKDIKRRYKHLRQQIDNKSQSEVPDQQFAKPKMHHSSQSNYSVSSNVSSNDQRASELNNLKARLRPQKQG